jgi:hypothetical protein
MHSVNETRAAHLCNALNEIGLQIEHPECVEILSKLGPGFATHAQNAELSDDQRRAEQYVDQLFDGMFEPNYTKFTQLFEEKFLIHIPEVEFAKNMQEENEKLGAYIGREYMGSVRGPKRAGDNRYPNLIRYLWRCYFEKNEALLRVGIYEKHGTYYVSGMHFI